MVDAIGRNSMAIRGNAQAQCRAPPPRAPEGPHRSSVSQCSGRDI